MKIITVRGAIALSLVLAACSPTENRGTESRQSAEAAQAPGEAAQVHAGTGIVKSIAGSQVSIAHGAIQSIDWPAMTMEFKAPTSVPQGVQVGTQVSFSFRKDNGGYVLTSVQPR